MKRIPVKKFMQQPPEAATQEMLLTELVALLRQRGYRALPVADADGRLLGVISETDLFLKEHKLPFSTQKVPSLLGELFDKEQIDEVEGLRKMTVGQVMHPTAVTVTEETPLQDLALLMSERHLSMVPVVRDNRLVGVARRSDVLEILYADPG